MYLISSSAQLWVVPEPYPYLYKYMFYFEVKFNLGNFNFIMSLLWAGAESRLFPYPCTRMWISSFA